MGSTDAIRVAISMSPPELLDIAGAGAMVIGTRSAMNSLILGMEARRRWVGRDSSSAAADARVSVRREKST